jgi:hypothetical protein
VVVHACNASVLEDFEFEVILSDISKTMSKSINQFSKSQ